MNRFMSYMKKEMIMAMVLAVAGIIIMCAIELRIAGNTAVTHNIEIWIEAASFLDFFFPMFVSLPFVWKLYFERKDGFIKYVSMRTDCRKYMAVKMLAGMSSVFVMVFAIYYAGLIFAEIFVEPKAIAQDEILGRYLWGKMQMEAPLMFGALWCVWKGLVGSVICLFGYFVALLSENIFIISLLPFLYCMLENFVTGTIGYERYSIYTSFVLNRLSPDAMRVHNYYAGVIIFVAVTGAIMLVWAFKKKQVDYREEHN